MASALFFASPKIALRTLSIRAEGQTVNVGSIRRHISSGEVFAALKPFFFAVHPDLFGQFPKEREVNENSLKQLNAYIESATHEKPLNPVNLTFYLRKNDTRTTNSDKQVFQAVSINLGNPDVRRTVYTILEKCNIPTTYVDNIPLPVSELNSRTNQGQQSIWKKYEEDYYERVERELAEKRLSQDNLMFWLERNAEGAKTKLEECCPVRDEVVRLKTIISKSVGLKELICDRDWSVTTIRGSLESFQILTSQHPEVMSVLNGKILIFGHQTGVTMDGHVVLNSGEVRKNWLDAIKNVSKHDAVIQRIPAIQRALSGSLKNIRVVHRKFQPNKMAQNYESELRKLTTSLGDYRGKASFPKEWPVDLSHFELVVETDAGPLMVSPTGQFIVPSSCPPFLLVNFITENMVEAQAKLDQYKREKYEEIALHQKCLKDLALVGMDKADNVTPNLMIDCCKRLIRHQSSLRSLLTGTHLWITTYYSVLSDGELCIPWNWKKEKGTN